MSIEHWIFQSKSRLDRFVLTGRNSANETMSTANRSLTHRTIDRHHHILVTMGTISTIIHSLFSEMFRYFQLKALKEYVGVRVFLYCPLLTRD